MKRDLIQRINALGKDGQELIEYMVERIEESTPEYGPLVIRDGVDYLEEAKKEIVDLPLWLGMYVMRTVREIKQWEAKNNGK